MFTELLDGCKKKRGWGEIPSGCGEQLKDVSSSLVIEVCPRIHICFFLFRCRARQKCKLDCSLCSNRVWNVMASSEMSFCSRLIWQMIWHPLHRTRHVVSRHRRGLTTLKAIEFRENAIPVHLPNLIAVRVYSSYCYCEVDWGRIRMLGKSVNNLKEGGFVTRHKREMEGGGGGHVCPPLCCDSWPVASETRSGS